MPSRARAIPIDFQPCPLPRKPKRTASAEEWSEYRAKAKAASLTVRGASRLRALRSALDRDQIARTLLMGVDGGYTNRTILRNLPERTTLIGRIRKDASLCKPPTPVDPASATSRGRKRSYGDPLPTPDALRQDPSIPWQTVSAVISGHPMQIDVKVIGPVRWRNGAGPMDLQLIIIRPICYRRLPGAKPLYRDPGYLIATDPNLDVATIVQAYLWRWEIEVNFHDEKTLLGAGEAQVRTEPAVRNAPAMTVAAFAYLLLADQRRSASADRPPKPLWRRPSSTGNERLSTSDMLRAFRCEAWGQALGVENISDFAATLAALTTAEKFKKSVSSAVIYAMN
jgi:hypothetical protein